MEIKWTGLIIKLKILKLNFPSLLNARRCLPAIFFGKHSILCKIFNFFLWEEKTSSKLVLKIMMD